MITRISYSHDGSFMHICKRAHMQSAIHSLPDINLNINFKAQNRKTKTDTILTLSLTNTGGTVLTLLLGYRSFIHYIGTSEKSVRRVRPTIRSE